MALKIINRVSRNRKDFLLKKTGRIGLVTSTKRPKLADATTLEPYDWGPKGVPKVKGLSFVAGKGWIIGE